MAKLSLRLEIIFPIGDQLQTFHQHKSKLIRLIRWRKKFHQKRLRWSRQFAWQFHAKTEVLCNIPSIVLCPMTNFSLLRKPLCFWPSFSARVFTLCIRTSFSSRSIQVGLMVRPRERASKGVWRKNVVTYPNCKYLPVWFSGHKIELCCWPFIVQLMERKLNWPTPARALIELLSKRWKYEHIESTIQCNREEWNSVEWERKTSIHSFTCTQKRSWKLLLWLKLAYRTII